MSRAGTGRVCDALSRRRPRRLATALALIMLGVAATGAAPAMHRGGPFDIILHATPAAPTASGTARLVYAESPFGVAVTADGRAVYDVEITAAGLPAPSALGAYSAYVAWSVSPDLSRWQRLGAVVNGTTTVGQADLNKFLLVITAEHDVAPAAHAGPTVLHGTSPSGWLQSFLTHPLFRGVSQ